MFVKPYTQRHVPERDPITYEHDEKGRPVAFTLDLNLFVPERPRERDLVVRFARTNEPAGPDTRRHEQHLTISAGPTLSVFLERCLHMVGNRLHLDGRGGKTSPARTAYLLTRPHVYPYLLSLIDCGNALTDRYPYPKLGQIASEAVRRALDYLFAHALRKPRTALERVAAQTGAYDVLAYARPLRRLTALAERNASAAHLLASLAAHAGTRDFTDEPSFFSAFAARPVSEDEFAQMWALLEADLLPELRAEQLPHLHQSLKHLDAPAVVAAAARSGEHRKALAFLDKIIGYQWIQPCVMGACRLAGTSDDFVEDLTRAARASGRSAADITHSFTNTNHSLLRQNASLEALRGAATGLFKKRKLALLQTEYTENIPPSDMIDADLIGSTDAFLKDIVETGAYMCLHNDMPYSYEDTAHVLRVSTKEGAIIAYVFLTHYFRTAYTWRINEELTKLYYGKIRYRISVIRKHTRILEALDV